LGTVGETMIDDLRFNLERRGVDINVVDDLARFT
jgi:hypothetical protein